MWKGSFHSFRSSVINSGGAISGVTSVMLWSPPGVGNSDAVRQIAAQIEHSCGKKVYVTDVRLMLFNPIDLRGIPTANDDKTLAVWLRPQIFDMDGGDDIVNILFLDEISAAPQSVQAAAYQITLDRTIGEHRLPDNCIVIAAGNRVTDRSVAYKMPKALANRLMHIEVSGSFSSWKKWAVAKGIDPRVIAFLSFRQDMLMGFDSSNDDLAFATPRSWEMVSRVLTSTGGSIDSAYPLIAGLIGTGAAIELRTWEKVYESIPPIEDIFAGRKAAVPKSADALYAVVSAMTAYAREHADEPELIANSIVYADKMPPEFSTILMKDYMSLAPDYRTVLMGIPEFRSWLNKKGRLMNGAV